MALLKGYLYKTWYPLRGIRFRAGPNFRVFGSLDVRGPGQVVFGKDVTVDMHVTPYTHDQEAVIEVGNHCFLNGVRLGCKERITIGDDCIVADARIIDTNFHSTRSDRWDPAAPIRTSPVHIARNVWIASSAALLPGTKIGANSVVGFGAICSGEFQSNAIIAGNPAVVVRDVEHPSIDPTEIPR
jgi:carbonic anhydrase/acetyltransferase-like protein (isoleucine patch superfamily)